MKVVRRLNNNVVLADDDLQEIVVMGKGVGFKVYPNDIVNQDLIEQTFIPTDNFNADEMAELICHSNPQEVKMVKEIIEYGESVLKKRLSENLLITLLDHLHFALIRYKKQMNTKSPIEWEIKQMYRTETQIGKKALRLIEDGIGITLPESEAVFIAMHFVNAQFENETMSETMDFSETMKQINSIIKYHFQFELNEQSVNYQRFLTHLRFYLIRQKKHEPLKLKNQELYFEMKERLPEESICVDKVSVFIKQKYGWETSYDEKLYLMLHINRLID